MLLDLEGKKAIVAGGGGAIGAAIAKALAQEGVDVVVLDLKHEEIADCQGIKFRRVDITRVDALKKEADSACEGGVDILVHAAGANLRKPFAEVTEKDWDIVQSVNLKSCFFLAQAVLPHMRERGGGSMVFISSCSAKLGFPGLTDYCASKGGLEAMVRSLACDAAPVNVRVNAVAPGTTKTPMTEGLWGDPRKCAAHEATIPLRRLACVDDQANAVLFLVSGLSTYITGAVLPVDGGLSGMQQDFVDLKLRSW